MGRFLSFPKEVNIISFAKHLETLLMSAKGCLSVEGTVLLEVIVVVAAFIERVVVNMESLSFDSEALCQRAVKIC